jgi:hypothetical protein
MPGKAIAGSFSRKTMGYPVHQAALAQASR